MVLMLMLLQQATKPGPVGIVIAQVAAVGFVIAVIALLAFYLIYTGIGETRLAAGERSWLDYGSFYVVALGIAGVLIGFLVILLFADRFTDLTQALGFLTALFGAITGLVGTYFGVKSSSDARAGVQQFVTSGGLGPRTATITITPPAATEKVNTAHTVTATVIAVDGSPAADVPVTFTVTTGPDTGLPSEVERTNTSGQATFQFTNGGTPGNDTIEATALGVKGTATVTFEQ